MRKFVSIITFFCLIMLISCQSDRKVTKAKALVQPRSGSNVSGEVVFTQVENGVLIEAKLTGLTPGKHGFHVHEKGDCSSDDAKSAGGHFNPEGSRHAGPLDPNRHIGDMGNIIANEDGVAVYKRVDDLMELNGKRSIVGKSVVVHQDEDDLVSQPSGNAGKRIGCGVIEAVEYSN